MKTLTEKTENLLEQVMCCDLHSDKGIDKAERLILMALKEQDRDTRHTCAEAVIQCNEDMSGECIWKNEAHGACMNAVPS